MVNQIIENLCLAFHIYWHNDSLFYSSWQQVVSLCHTATECWLSTGNSIFFRCQTSALSQPVRTGSKWIQFLAHCTSQITICARCITVQLGCPLFCKCWQNHSVLSSILSCGRICLTNVRSKAYFCILIKSISSPMLAPDGRLRLVAGTVWGSVWIPATVNRWAGRIICI